MLLPRVGWEVAGRSISRETPTACVSRLLKRVGGAAYAMPGAMASTSFQSAAARRIGGTNEIRRATAAGADFFVTRRRNQATRWGKRRYVGERRRDARSRLGSRMRELVPVSDVGEAKKINVTAMCRWASPEADSETSGDGAHKINRNRRWRWRCGPERSARSTASSAIGELHREGRSPSIGGSHSTTRGSASARMWRCAHELVGGYTFDPRRALVGVGRHWTKDPTSGAPRTRRCKS